jgi:RNA polymerase sigma-70 factor (ECF subfamily)
VGSRAVAEELVQDVMLEVWTGRGTWVVRSSVKAYLYGAVRNQALNVQRRKRLELRYEERAVTEGLVADVTVPAAEIDERLTDERRLKAITQAVQRLKEPRRTILTLRWDHGMTHREIAETLGMSLRAVEMAAARAMATVKRKLARLK